MTNLQAEQRVQDHLDTLGIAHEPIWIDPELADTAEFCRHYGYALEDSANCIIVASRTDPPVFAACLNLATTKLDVNKRVRRLLGVRKLSFATAEQTAALTGMTIGGVTPFALPDDLRLFIDSRVMDRPQVIVGGGSRRLKLLVAPSALARLPGAEIAADLANPL